jgi:CRISPR/Cas system CSM-associated protein Csm3 (group 7 of RAMP superfamily)
MARKISKRIKITGTIEAQTPLHVGGLGTDPTVDLPLAVAII